MSLKELIAAATLGTSYLDARYHIVEDVTLIQYVVKAGLTFIYECLKGRVNFWYKFESIARSYPGNAAICFPRPVKQNEATANLPQNGDGSINYDDMFEVEHYTYQEMYDIVLRLSYILTNQYGVKARQTIALDFTNKPLFIFMWFALWNIGALPAFLNHNAKSNALIHCLEITNALQVFIDPDAAGPIKETEADIKSKLPHVKLNYLNEYELLNIINSNKQPKFRQVDKIRNGDDKAYSPAILIYTSGTTGLPKSAIMSWKKVWSASSLFAYIMKLSNPKSNSFTAMPLYHSTAAVLGVIPSFANGSCVSLSQKFSTRTFWTQAKLCGATHIQYVGEVCRYLLHGKYHPDERNHKVRIAYGNGLRPDIWTEFKSRYGIKAIGEFYASTESPIATTSLQCGDYGIGAVKKYGSLISFILSFQQRLVKLDPDDSNEVYRNSTGFCEQPLYGEPGELLMRINFPKNPETEFQGYYNNKKATSDKIIYDVFKKGDCWFRCGDLLKMDKDNLLYFVDRLGDTFRWKSENVSATEVENELVTSKLIKQAVVVGVKVPNHEGRAGFAVIEPIDSFSSSESYPELLSKLLAHSQSSLPKYSIPAFIKIDKIKTTDNHKVPKNQFKNQKLPDGDGKDTIYWMNQNKYEVLDKISWNKIISGRAKL